MFFDDGQTFTGSGTFSETKTMITLSPYQLIRSEYAIGLSKAPSTVDSTFIKEESKFFKKGNYLIYVDEHDKAWRQKKENLYLPEPK